MNERPKNFDEVPPEFQESLHHNLLPDESVYHLIFSPEFVTATTHHSASALCITDRRWVIALKERDGAVTTHTATFDETLLVELTIILLHGKIAIHFAKDGETRSAALYFNTVMKTLYYAAVCGILRGIEGERSGRQPKPISPFSDWPQKFQNLSIIYTPPEERLVDGAYSRPIYGLLTEKAPATAILLTERHIIVIAEEKSRRWFPSRKAAKYGGTMSYIPKRRVAQWEVIENNRIDLHLITLSGNKGVGRFEVLFSPEKRSDAGRISEEVVIRSTPAVPVRPDQAAQ
jgi:hypothetical protein